MYNKIIKPVSYNVKYKIWRQIDEQLATQSKYKIYRKIMNQINIQVEIKTRTQINIIRAMIMNYLTSVLSKVIINPQNPFIIKNITQAIDS